MMLTRKRNAGLWFSLFAIVLWLTAGTIAHAQADHVAGLWHFDGNYLDSSGNGNLGTPYGGTGFTNNFKFGDPGEADAAGFDGSSGYIDVADSPSLDITDEITLEAWIKPNSFNQPGGQGDGNIYVISKDTSGARSYGLGVSDPVKGGTVSCGASGPHAFLIIFNSNTTYSIACAEKPLTLGVWHHLAGTYDGSELKIYVDGVLDGTASGSGAINVGTADVEVGAREYTGYRAFFDGIIDEARIWNRDLSSDEIMSSAQAGLRADWHFDENSGTLTADSSGYGNTGTINDASWGPATPSPSLFSHLTFDGTDDYVAVDHSSTLDMTSAYTVEGWVYLDEASPPVTYRPIAVRGDASLMENDIEIYWQRSSGDLIVAHNRNNGGTFDYVGFADPPTQQWFHLAVTFDGTDVHVCYNGVAATVTQQTAAMVPPLASGKGWLFGQISFPSGDTGGFGSGPFYLKGSLDEIHIWARALNPAEIAFLHTSEGELFVPEEVSQEFGSGAVFTSDWHVGNTPANSNAIALGFIVPDDFGTTIDTIEPKKHNPSTPADGAELAGFQNGTPSLWTLITAYRTTTDAHTLHLQTTLSDSTELGMNDQWSAP